MPVVSIPLAGRGLSGVRDPAKVKTGDLALANNVDFTVGNLLQKDGGSTKINAVAITGAPKITCGFDWWPTASTQRRVIATDDGNLYKDDMTGAFATNLATGLTINTKTQMVEAGAELAGNNRKLFIFNGADAVQVLDADAATTAGISGGAAEWSGINHPSFGFLFRNALIAGGAANDGHRIYGSQTSDHETMTAGDSYTVNVYPGEGQRLVSGIAAMGRAYLFKYPTGIYWMNDVDASAANWYVQPATRQFGVANTPHAVTQVDDGTVAFISNTGNIVLMQETAGALSGVQFIDLTKTLNLRTYLKNNFNLARLPFTQVRWYEDKNQLHVLMADQSSLTEDRRLVLDFNEENTRVSVVTKDTNSSIWMELDSDNIGRPIAGDNVGFVRKLDQISRTVDGTAYSTTLQTVPTDFSDINPEYMAKKLFYRLHLEYEPQTNYDLPVEIIVDGKSMGTVQFNQGGAGAVFPFMLDATLGGDELKRRSRDIAGEGFYFSLRISDTTSNNVRLSRAWVEFRPTSTTR